MKQLQPARQTAPPCSSLSISFRLPACLPARPLLQAIGLLDDLDKELNTYAMRVREWYGWHFPEMTKIVADNIAYAKTGEAAALPAAELSLCSVRGRPATAQRRSWQRTAAACLPASCSRSLPLPCAALLLPACSQTDGHPREGG